MTEQLTLEQKKLNYLQSIYDRIIISRTMLNKREMAPKGFIFYSITLKTFKDEKYTGVRRINLTQEKAMGMDAICLNIKKELAKKYFDYEFDLSESE